MIMAAAFSRLIPHPWNFTAVGAMALIGGAMLQSKKKSLMIPIAALFLSDLVVGFQSTMVYVYFGFAASVCMGWSLQNNRSAFRVGTLSLISSAIFFLLTNFGVWLEGGFYTQNFQGLISCYLAALPFFDNQIIGDLFYSSLLFAGYEFLKNWVPALSSSTK
jgi:hypothetical protein